MSELQNVSNAVIQGDAMAAEEATRAALNKGLSAAVILKQGLIPAMDVVGQAMKSGEYFIPEVLLSSRAFGISTAILEPFITEGDLGPSPGKVVLGAVKGDLHDIGKKLVGVMLRGAGFEIVDIGVDVTPQRFLEAVRDAKADILGLSALLTTTMVGMKDVISYLEDSAWREKVKVIIGGAPVTPRFAEEIGADGYSPDAAGAVDLARRLVVQPGA